MNLFENSDIETLFKVEMPITPVKVGHGYLGVILRNKKTDQLQCHICGQWHEHLAFHIRFKHKIKCKDYRIKFSLPLNYGLVNSAISKKKSEFQRGSNNTWQKNFLKNPPVYDRKKHLRATRYGCSNMAFQNKKGACKEQMLRRFMIVADIVGREPTKLDLRTYDCSLLNLIVNKYGTLNNYRAKNSFTVTKANPYYTEEKLISYLRKFYIKNKRKPVSRDFKGFQSNDYPSSVTIFRRFGSWRKALSMAGL